MLKLPLEILKKTNTWWGIQKMPYTRKPPKVSGAIPDNRETFEAPISSQRARRKIRTKKDRDNFSINFLLKMLSSTAYEDIVQCP